MECSIMEGFDYRERIRGGGKDDLGCALSCYNGPTDPDGSSFDSKLVDANENESL